MSNKISVRQLCFFLAFVAPVGKIVLLPSRLVHFAKNDLLLPAALQFALQAGIVFLVVLLSRKGETLYELLRNAFGKVVASILFVLFACFFLFAALYPVQEQKLLVQSVFYDTLPSLFVFAPFFVLSAYLCAKPLFVCGRTWDALAPLSAVAFAGLMILSAGEADFGALQPAGASAPAILKAFAYTSNWFCDSAFLLLLTGRLEYRKGMAWKALLSYLAGALAVLFFLAVYYGIFSDIAVRQSFAFAKISKYFSAVSVLGRVDYLFIYLLGLVMTFYCIVPLQASATCLREAFGERGKPALYSVAVNAAVLLVVIFTDLRFLSFQETVTVKLFWIFPLFTVLVPLLCLFLGRSRREKILR